MSRPGQLLRAMLAILSEQDAISVARLAELLDREPSDVRKYVSNYVQRGYLAYADESTPATKSAGPRLLRSVCIGPIDPMTVRGALPSFFAPEPVVRRIRAPQTDTRIVASAIKSRTHLEMVLQDWQKGKE